MLTLGAISRSRHLWVSPSNCLFPRTHSMKIKNPLVKHIFWRPSKSTRIETQIFAQLNFLHGIALLTLNWHHNKYLVGARKWAFRDEHDVKWAVDAHEKTSMRISCKRCRTMCTCANQAIPKDTLLRNLALSDLRHFPRAITASRKFLVSYSVTITSHITSLDFFSPHHARGALLPAAWFMPMVSSTNCR